MLQSIAVMRTLFAGLLSLAMIVAVSLAAEPPPRRDEFFWLGAINQASAVINTDEGLLDRALAPRLAAGIRKVSSDGNRAGARRPATVIAFEPLLIEAAGVEVTLLHAGRSSQDMHATFRAAMLRDDLLSLAEQLNRTTATVVQLAERHAGTVVPNYTNGVAAQPNSLGHYLLGHAAGLERHAQRIREAYARVDRSPMGTTVLNGTSWPLNRRRMADYLGFAALVDNAFDAAQISTAEHAVEAAAIVTAVALQAGGYIEDVMTQYAQSQPWMILAEGGGNTYVSSAMPQKANPGLLNSARRDASEAVTLALGPVLQSHNIPPGMADAKEVRANAAVLAAGTRVLQNWNRILDALVIDQARALEELNRDWTASQELADVLMRDHKVPFRVGHHFASALVAYGRAHHVRPAEFPFAEARRIYREEMKGQAELPLSEAQFRAALDPVAIVRNRATSGGPQPAEMARMIAAASQTIAQQTAWIADRRGRIAASLARLDADFEKLLGN